jgi:ABC-type sugar transport system ATPase subunit
VIRTENLTVQVGSFRLRGITLTIEAGRYAVLLGPTGTGKTVLLETLVGLNRAEGGSVWVGEADVTRLSPERRGIGFVYQRSMLFPHLSVRQNIAYGLRYHGVRRSQETARVEETAELLRVRPLLDRTVHALSGGETQKVALARALAIHPRVLLLDEPLEALDPISKEALVAELRSLHQRTGMTILHVTHDQQIARSLGQVLGILRDGQLLQFGPKDEVFDRPASAFVARFVGTENVFEGTATRTTAGCEVALGCGTLRAAEPVSGPVGLCIRPELITIEPAADDAPAESNRIEGRVASVTDRGALVRYEVATSQEPFVVLQTKKEYAAAGAAVGQPVRLTFAPSAVHVFRRHGPGQE